jgi:hypothetical protein
MQVFEVYRNGRKLCAAGVGEHGVLSAIVVWHSPEPVAEGSEDVPASSVHLSVSGLSTSAPDHQLYWMDAPLCTDDEVVIRVREAVAVDPPELRERPGPGDVLREKQEYVRRMAQELGWTITEM